MERQVLLRQELANATQRIQWNYSIFWSFCPQRQVLVWGEGYLNGAESTELSLRRSQQLRELFTAMNADTGATTSSQLPSSQANSVSQQVEGLTPTEWFYMCSMTCLFASGEKVGPLWSSLTALKGLKVVGLSDRLPGRAYAEKRYVWHCITNEDDTRAFVRARLAQTIVCIPALDGVIEFGTSTLVEETTPLLRQMQSLVLSAHMITDMSAFKRWSTRAGAPHMRQKNIYRQQMLKAALLNVPRLYAAKEKVHVIELGEGQAASDRLRGSQASTHVVAERRRREKLNNRFVTLRSLVPLATKSDKVSLLGGAIEYVRVLQRRVEELEANRKRRQVEVTMENNNITVKITCPWKHGLFIDILQRMGASHLEVLEATAKASDGLLTATLKAKVTSSDKLDNDENKLDNDEKRDKIQAALLSTIEEKLTEEAHEP